MNYEHDILARRSMIVAAFRVLEAKDPKAHEKKLCKKYGSILPVAVGFALASTGNCRASKEDSVDESLSLAFGWKTIRQLREEDIKRNREEFEIMRKGA